MHVLDPLKMKITELVESGQSEPLNQARLRYGTQHDVEALVDQYRELPTDARRYIYIDLTPFERIGHLKFLIESLKVTRQKIPVLMVMSQELKEDIIQVDDEVLVLEFDEVGAYKNLVGGGADMLTIVEQVVRDFRNRDGNKSLAEFRQPIAERLLTDLLFKPGCLLLPNTNCEETDFSTYRGGRYFLKMPNGMLVSCYLNLKQIGKSHGALITLAYEAVLQLSEFFRRDIDALSQHDYLIAPNNTALFLTSAIQAITEQPLMVIDRLGPIPSLKLDESYLRKYLAGKDVVLVEEVVATGNEVDRALLFLNQLNAKVRKVIAFYNLKVGEPMLVEDGQLVSLCQPKQELDYVYRSN